MKAFALIKMQGPIPDLPDAAWAAGINYVLCDRIPGTGWGAYLVAADGPVLQALDTQCSTFVGIVAVTESGAIRWGELENPCSETVRTKLNTWLEARNHPTIPESWTNRQVVREIYQRANARFDLDRFDVIDR